MEGILLKMARERRWGRRDVARQEKLSSFWLWSLTSCTVRWAFSQELLLPDTGKGDPLRAGGHDGSGHRYAADVPLWPACVLREL